MSLLHRLLPVNDLSNVDFPTIQVNANLPGANPDTMAALLRIWSRNASYTSTI